MRMIYSLLLLVCVACGGTGKKTESASSGAENVGIETKSDGPGTHCTKHGLCYEDVSRGDHDSDEELMCARYCTAYCACYEETEGEECYEGGGCVMSCEKELVKEEKRDDWIRRMRCAQKADCKRFMDECY